VKWQDWRVYNVVVLAVTSDSLVSGYQGFGGTRSFLHVGLQCIY